MISFRQTEEFKTWLADLRDRSAAAVIARRIARLQQGLFGDVQPIGEGLSELRVHVGPGYRVYLVQRGAELVILLCGSDKSDQSRAIKLAKRLAQEV